MQPQEIATVETDLFEHREVKPHFINDCCFGEDFAAWLRQRLAELPGFEFSEPIQEDYGWGLSAAHGKEKFWIALSYVGDGPTETPAQWVVSIAHHTGLNIFRKLFSKPDLSVLETLRARIRRELEGRNVPLSAFVQKSIVGTVRGMVSALKDCDSPQRFELQIFPDKDPQKSGA